MMHDDDRDLEQFARTLRELDTPPPAPREEMWARISAARQARGNGNGTASAPVAEPPSSRHDAGVVALPVRTRRSYVQWGAGLAAMLVIGIGLGRVSMQQATTIEPPATVATPALSPIDDVASSPYRLAAATHLQRTEALLTALAMDAQADGTRELTTWAGELLTDTRMLLATPVAEDPAIGRLLEDLELLLAQVAAIPSARANEEVELIQDGLNQGDVLPRLRAAATVRRTVGT